jgi:hypothetical protein
MLFEEPCYEGYVLMGAMTQFMPDILKGHGVTLTDKQFADIQIFADAMKFYARRDPGQVRLRGRAPIPS